MVYRIVYGTLEAAGLQKGVAARCYPAATCEWSGRESNPRPLQCDCSALPAELPPRVVPILETRPGREQALSRTPDRTRGSAPVVPACRFRTPGATVAAVGANSATGRSRSA